MNTPIQLHITKHFNRLIPLVATDLIGSASASVIVSDDFTSLGDGDSLNGRPPSSATAGVGEWIANTGFSGSDNGQVYVYSSAGNTILETGTGFATPGATHTLRTILDTTVDGAWTYAAYTNDIFHSTLLMLLYEEFFCT
ncbi:MAG: hypothetical protein PF795_01065 [Kiritimatiellae bacterium]|nr:hypothetical protein [Kiritimatiellia bacterium]